jgi:hypothetical protein
VLLRRTANRILRPTIYGGFAAWFMISLFIVLWPSSLNAEVSLEDTNAFIEKWVLRYGYNISDDAWSPHNPAQQVTTKGCLHHYLFPYVKDTSTQRASEREPYNEVIDFGQLDSIESRITMGADNHVSIQGRTYVGDGEVQLSEEGNTVSIDWTWMGEGVKPGAAPEARIYVQDRAIGDRITTAMRHLAELCGSGNDPF